MTPAHTVGEVAKRAGISVRTLHHYDEIGLLSPSRRSAAGYRLYDISDVERLQQILFYRELGLPLDEISRVMSDPGFDRAEALYEQRTRLEARAEHLMRMIDAVEHAIHAHEKGENMSTDEMLGVFGGFDAAEYEQEANERWGHSEAYKESARRTAEYTRDDWERMAAEADEIYRAFMELKEAGVPADAPAAIEVAERHRTHIGTWFYECSPEMHGELGEMYVQDQRFTASIDEHGDGLAAYMSEAILANAGHRR